MDSQVDNSESSLLEFVNVKRKINDLFDRLEELTKEIRCFMENITKNPRLTDIHLQKSELEEIDSSVKKIDGIKNIISRDCVKVAFFGRTSNGKSTAINAMLNEDILPRGVGHTTNCFVQIEGSDENKSYLTLGKSKEERSIESINELASALSDTHLKEDELVRISWPREKCELLRCDVVIIDSPGVDAEVNIDTSIDNFCLDADIFVFVVNAESTLTNSESSFFEKVCKKLTKPNVFVLFNKWDNCASESDSQKVKIQHKKKCIEFLTNKLQVCTSSDAEERMFFISAKETLLARLNDDKKNCTNLDGFDSRYSEFQDFEKKFHESISQSVINTKFGRRWDEGNSISNNIKNDLSHILNRIIELKLNKLNEKENLQESLNRITQQFNMICDDMKKKIITNVEKFNEMFSNQFDLIIGSIPGDCNITIDVQNQHDFEKKLRLHVENKQKNSIMTVILSVNMIIEAMEMEIIEKLRNLTPEEKRVLNISLVNTEQSPPSYLWDCNGFFDDFDQSISLPTNICGRVLPLASGFVKEEVMGVSKAFTSAAVVGVLADFVLTEFQKKKLYERYMTFTRQKLRSMANERCERYCREVKEKLSATLDESSQKVCETIEDMELKLEELIIDISVLNNTETRAKELIKATETLTGEFIVFN